MNTLFRRFIMLLVSICLILAACGEYRSSGSEEEHYVVIISIDGFLSESLWDRRVPLPTIRSLAEDGVWSAAMIPSSPSVTWPNHTTLTTGVHPEKHGVLTNGIFVRSGVGEPVYRENNLDRDELSVYPTLYDLAYEAGLRTADVNWPVTRNSNTLHDSFPDAVDPVTHTTPQFLTEMIELGLLADKTEAAFNLGAVSRDYVRTKAAAHLIQSRQPNVLLLHLLNVDGTHHGFGKQSNPGNTALAYADANVRVILDALEEAGIRDRTSIFIVSDHGFMNVTERIQPNVLLKQNGLLEADDAGNIINGRVQVLSNGGSAMVFAPDPATKEEDLELARSLFEGAQGIARVLEPHEYEAYGLPQPSENESMGDLVLGADDGHAFINSAAGDDFIVSLDITRGTHGYLNDVPQMETIFIASGRGIRSGTELATVDNRSVAPTAAWLLGLALDTADGELLESILEE
jgi:predicted AlkP superfamily pyrophosphatase or phosphodiesterase